MDKEGRGLANTEFVKEWMNSRLHVELVRLIEEIEWKRLHHKIITVTKVGWIKHRFYLMEQNHSYYLSK